MDKDHKPLLNPKAISGVMLDVEVHLSYLHAWCIGVHAYHESDTHKKVK